MLQAFFLWFYCLQIPKAVLLVIAVSAVFLILRQWLGKKRFWWPAITLFFLVWIIIIAVATLINRTLSTVPSDPQLLPFHSYRAVITGGNREILRSNFMNVVLFYPAGLFGCELLPKCWSFMRKAVFVVFLTALIGAGIEFCQYFFALGLAETDDIIHNALGALLGVLICSIHIGGKRQ